MTDRKATIKEIRKHYKDAGHTVRISQDGHVEYKLDGEGQWLEGRWAEEYRIVDGVGAVAL